MLCEFSGLDLSQSYVFEDFLCCKCNGAQWDSITRLTENYLQSKAC